MCRTFATLFLFTIVLLYFAENYDVSCAIRPFCVMSVGGLPSVSNHCQGSYRPFVRCAADPDIARPYPKLALLVYQETNSLLTSKEIDPLDLAELFGTVGGFWDLLLILWPIFFVASSRQAPHLKGRSFDKAVTKGMGGIRNGSPVEQVDPS
ncbi:unnamed protein product [Ectocarpus sp. 13 AM-2016]